MVRAVVQKAKLKKKNDFKLNVFGEQTNSVSK